MFYVFLLSEGSGSHGSYCHKYFIYREYFTGDVGHKRALSLPQQNGLADLVTCVLLNRSVNTIELAQLIPRDMQDPESRFRYVHRFLSSTTLQSESVMAEWVRALWATLFPPELIHVLIMDQTKINDTHEALVVSIWWNNRALPLFWTVVNTKGEIGFDHQEPLCVKWQACFLPPPRSC